MNDDTVMYSEDPGLGPLTGQMIQLRELQSDLWGGTAELLAKAVDQGSLDDEISTEDRERLLEFLVDAVYLDDADGLYSPNAERRDSPGADDLQMLLQSPFAIRVRSIASGTGGPVGYFQPTAGMMEIPLAFQRAMEDHRHDRTPSELEDGVPDGPSVLGGGPRALQWAPSFRGEYPPRDREWSRAAG